MKFFNQAASLGSAEALFELSGFYLTGKKELGIAANSVEAYAKAKAAAELGYAKAQYGMGVYCDQGIGLPARDEKAAQDWYLKAYKQGDKKAAAKLGMSLPKSRKGNVNCKMM